jgi:uncharacterized surface protein with fasciclin (FAS1) repeats
LLNFLKFKLFKIMKNLKKLFAPLSIVLLSVVVFSSCKDDAPVVAAPKDIVGVALADAQFSNLTDALTKAGLVATLQTAGPFTVFAPNNAAFTKAGISVSAATKEALSPILLYHVLGAKVLAGDIKTGQTEVGTAGTGGPKMYITKNANGVFINGNTKVTVTDVTASNGVIHVLDNVLIPPSQDVFSIAELDKDKRFTTLVNLVKQTGLESTLKGATGSFTVFAPTNDAFTELFKTVNPATLTNDQIKNILLYHVFTTSRVFSSDLTNGDITMANGGKVTVDLTSGVAVKGKSNTATTTPKVVIANLLGTNGVVHAIDKVLLP